VIFTGDEFTAKNNLAGNTPSASSHGGAIRALSLEINGKYDISGNSALGSGGGVSTSRLSLAGGGTMAGNIAHANGGAIYARGDSELVIGPGAVFLNNISGGQGGAIYAGGASLLSLDAGTSDIIFQGNCQGATVDYGAIASGGMLNATPGSGTANAIYFAQSATMELNAGKSRAIQFDDPISGTTGKIITVNKRGEGAVIFSTHHSDLLANTTVEAGAFVLADGAVYGAANNSGTFIVRTGAVLSGNGTVLSGDIQIENNTTLMALEDGLLAVDTSNALQIGTGLALAGSGTIHTGDAANIVLNASIVRAGAALPSATPAILVISNSVSLADNATLMVNLYGGNKSDQFVAANGLASNGLTRVDLGLVETGSFTIASWTSGGVNAGQLSLTFNGGAQTNRNDACLGVDAAARTLYVTNTVQSLALIWTGLEGDMTWRSSPVESANWTDGNATSPERYFRNGDMVAFGAVASGTITIATDGVTISGMSVSGPGDYIFQGAGGITANTTGAEGATITATGKLLKTGAGKLVFANTAANSFSGGMEIKGGGVDVAPGSGLAGAILVDNAAGAGALLSGQGAFGDMIIKNGGGFKIGTSSAISGTAVADSLTLDQAVLHFDLFSNNTSDYLLINSAPVVLNSSTSTIMIGAFASGTFNLGNLGSIAGNLGLEISGRQSGGLENGATGELLLKTMSDISRVLRWQGQAGSTWDAGTASWDGDKSQFADGDRVIFDDTPDPSNREIILPGGGVKTGSSGFLVAEGRGGGREAR
jgi:autotransporter-associated beta strand protein/predicted outer membrane repeat protein